MVLVLTAGVVPVASDGESGGQRRVGSVDQALVYQTETIDGVE